MEAVKNFFSDMFFAPIGEASFATIILWLCVLTIGAVLLVLLVKGIWLCLKKIGKALFVGKSAKAKCKKIRCRYCGRSLYDCTCQQNKNLSYRKRLKKYKKELKELKEKERAEKQAEKENKKREEAARRNKKKSKKGVSLAFSKKRNKHDTNSNSSSAGPINPS